MAQFYARFSLRIGIFAYIVIWTFIGYGILESNPILSIFDLWKEFLIWAISELSLNTIIPYTAIIEGVIKNWNEANVFDLDNTGDLIWVFLIVWPVVFTLQSQFAFEIYIIAPLLLALYLLNQDLFVQDPDTIEELRGGFSYFDYNEDGFITYDDYELAEKVEKEGINQQKPGLLVQPKRAAPEEIDILMKELNKDKNGRVDFNTFTTWFAGGCPEEISLDGLKYCTEEGLPTALSYWYFANRLLILDPSILRSKFKPTIDYNTFLMLIPLSFA